MTEADMRTLFQKLTRENTTNAGTKLPDTATIDIWLDTALDVVILDLVKLTPEDYLLDEDVSLVANQKYTDLTATFLQIWDVQKNLSDYSPTPFNFVARQDRQNIEYVGETHEEPVGWYRMGQRIFWMPTPDRARTNFVTFTLVVSDAMATNGPAYIPKAAHRLIPIMAAILFLDAFGERTAGLKEVYTYFMDKYTDVAAHVVQGEARYLVGSRQGLGSTREKTEYDPYWR